LAALGERLVSFALARKTFAEEGAVAMRELFRKHCARR
jgi:hypothetical protein